MIYVSSDTQVGRRAALRSSWMFWLQKNWLVTAPQTVVANTWERVQNTRAHRTWQAGTSDSRGFGHTCRLTVVSSVGRQERRLSSLHPRQSGDAPHRLRAHLRIIGGLRIWPNGARAACRPKRSGEGRSHPQVCDTTEPGTAQPSSRTAPGRSPLPLRTADNSNLHPCHSACRETSMIKQAWQIDDTVASKKRRESWYSNRFAQCAPLAIASAANGLTAKR